MGKMLTATPATRLMGPSGSTGPRFDVHELRKRMLSSGENELNGSGPAGTRLLRSDQDYDDTEPLPSYEEALQRLIALWAEKALFHAMVRDIDDPVGVVASIAGINGPRGLGHSPEEALEALNSALIDWADAKLKNGDDDIPSMGGVQLVIDR